MFIFRKNLNDVPIELDNLELEMSESVYSRFNDLQFCIVNIMRSFYRDVNTIHFTDQFDS